MSDCESQDYCSSEDEDYVPSGGEYSEDDVRELVKEDSGDEHVEEKFRKSCKGKSKKKRTKSYPARKLTNCEDRGEQIGGIEATSCDAEDGDILSEIKQKKLEEANKKREDDLWASFMSDVSPKSQLPPPTCSSLNDQTIGKTPKDTKNISVAKNDTSKQKDKTMVTITKVFDFAGEEVRITKEVDSSSKEAKSFIKQQEKSVQEPSEKSSNTSIPLGSGMKRPGGMSSILGNLGSKKQKMSTLEKSKMDWEAFKEKEGIGEELAIHNRGKDGYIERKAFLERVDYRQFEREREIRLKNMKP
ncbi:hypothetical protein GDO86_008434 [Hymenochirus boettgeri]|uniref:Craniofacial development protein 1 n=1 Tax=Hymenochirus boettgeri TaxID=247094 RepID=A0A8T2J319_9PIPI|nr:hypothetical protein GDO86_008434 [Hymenochirus boettgeri]